MLSILGATSRVFYRLLAGVCLGLSSLNRAEAGLATASLVMLTMAGTTTAVATVTVTSDDFSFNDLDALVYQSVDRIGASLEIRGSIIAHSSADARSVKSIQMTLGTFGQGTPVLLDPAAPADQRLEIDYSDSTSYVADVPYSVKFLGGNGDSSLDPGELMVLTVDISGLPAPDGTSPLTGGQRWTLQLIAPIGGTVEISRTAAANPAAPDGPALTRRC